MTCHPDSTFSSVVRNMCGDELRSIAAMLLGNGRKGRIFDAAFLPHGGLLGGPNGDNCVAAERLTIVATSSPAVWAAQMPPPPRSWGGNYAAQCAALCRQMPPQDRVLSAYCIDPRGQYNTGGQYTRRVVFTLGGLADFVVNPPRSEPT